MKIIFAMACTLLASVAGSQDTLYVYGPGGPLAPIEVCGRLFAQHYSIPVKVIAGPEARWIDQARQNADLVFGGAEYMLTQFMMQHPGLVDSTTRTELYKRPAAILVRPGNPKNIKNFRDLAKPGIRLLDVNGAGQLGMWEDIAGKMNLIGPIQNNIVRSFPNTALAIEAWKSDSQYDAWIIYGSWHYRLKDVTSLVPIPAGLTVFRGTPIAVTRISDQRADALKFIRFLQTPEAHRVFQQWGWH